MTAAPDAAVPEAVLRDVDAAPLPPPLRLATLAAPGVRSLKRNWPAIVGLQVAGLAVVVGYYASPSARAVCDRLAEWKAAGGLAAAAGLMAVACAIVPEVAKTLFGVDRTFGPARWRTVAFNVGLFAAIGLLVDCFYRLLTLALGGDTTPGVVLAKVAIDQFVYTPTLGVTVMAVAYTWREHRYNLRRLFAALGPHWYLTRTVILLLPCWAYWIPMTLLMYSLPPGLTFVFGVSASAAAALLLTTVAAEASTPARPNI